MMGGANVIHNNLAFFSTVFFSKPNMNSLFERSRQAVSASSIENSAEPITIFQAKIVLGKCAPKDFITSICLTWKNVSLGKVFNR
jgi:hypothetical protein